MALCPTTWLFPARPPCKCNPGNKSKTLAELGEVEGNKVSSGERECEPGRKGKERVKGDQQRIQRVNLCLREPMQPQPPPHLPLSLIKERVLFAGPAGSHSPSLLLRHRNLHLGIIDLLPQEGSAPWTMVALCQGTAHLPIWVTQVQPFSTTTCVGPCLQSLLQNHS